MLASIYHYIYHIIVIILTIFAMSSYKRWNPSRNNSYKYNNGGLFIITIFFIFAIGLRPVSYSFIDMMAYSDYYDAGLGSQFFFTFDTDNYLFDNIVPWFASNYIPLRWFYLLIAAIYFGGIALACKKIFPQDALLAFIVFLGAFSTFSYGTNGIKAGAAASIFLLALAYRENKVLSLFLLWVTLGFHHSMLAPIVAYVIALFYKNPKAYLIAWIVCLLLAAAHVTFFQSFFSGFTDEHGASYLTVDSYEKAVSGFRPDFILYSAVPVFLGYYLMTKKHIKSDYFNFLWCIYTATNCVFLLCTYGSFINRIAYLSWLMYPIVLLYPFINISWSQNQKKYLNYTVYFHLSFTVFMVFIYYGLLAI